MQITRTKRGPLNLIVSTIVIAMLAKSVFGYTLTGLLVCMAGIALVLLLPKRVSVAMGHGSFVPSDGRKEFLKQRGFMEGGEPSTQLAMTLENGGKVETDSVITGNILGYPACIYNYLTWRLQNDTVTTGETLKGDVVLRVLEVTLDHTFPRLYVSPSISSLLDNLLLTHPTLERIVTESTFGDRYAIYMQKGHGSESLELLTPDVMEQIINNFPALSFELAPSRLYVFYNPYENNTYEKLFSEAEFLIPQILRRS